MNVRGVLGALAVAAVTVILAALSTTSLIGGIAAIAIAGFIAMLAAFGPEAVGLLLLFGAFATAPMYKGLSLTHGSSITTTDVLFVLGFALLVPRMIQGRPRLDPIYVTGITLLFVCGTFASLLNANAVSSMIQLILWLTAIFVLPAGIAFLQPSDRLINAFCLSYVGGQMFDTLYAIAKNRTHRWYGLSTHPNYFGQCALLSFCLLLFLLHRVEDRHRRWVYLAMLVCLVDIVLSGSRAATLVVAITVVLIPVVERTSKSVTAVIGLGAGALFAAAALIPGASSNSSIGRLLGQGSSTGSDQARSQGLSDGLQLVYNKPILGHGIDKTLIFPIHNNYLEVAVVVGLLGLGAYIMVVWPLLSPAFGNLPLRRLSYVTIAFVGFSATTPGLFDRSVWCLLALTALIYRDRATEKSNTQDLYIPTRMPALSVGGSHLV